ncbi:MAG TPA: DUF6438 domain-containing protein [Rhizomicrobium sp.]|nr:DUF6438 domain-containing protein [Rhizomicrobium sp.]
MKVGLGLFALMIVIADAAASSPINLLLGPREAFIMHGPPAAYLKKEPFPPIKDWSSLRMTLRRGRCLGTCPAYDVEIGGDGTVVFDGYACVAQRGRHVSKIPIADVHALFEQFRAVRIFDLRPEFVATITDGPPYQLSIRFDRHAASVGDYIGTMVGMPENVRALEDTIDRVARIGELVGDRPQRWAAC